jgi:hypothetical protein
MKQTFETLFLKLLGFMHALTAIVIGLAVVGFMWGIVKVLFSSENQVAKTEGRAYMMYGIITLFVMTCVWGLVGLLSQTIVPTTGNTNTNSTTHTNPNQPVNDTGNLHQGLYDD